MLTIKTMSVSYTTHSTLCWTRLATPPPPQPHKHTRDDDLWKKGGAIERRPEVIFAGKMDFRERKVDYRLEELFTKKQLGSTWNLKPLSPWTSSYAELEILGPGTRNESTNTVYRIDLEHERARTSRPHHQVM